MKHPIIRRPDGTIDHWETCCAAGREWGADIRVEGAANLVINYQRRVGQLLLRLEPDATEVDVP